MSSLEWVLVQETASRHQEETGHFGGTVIRELGGLALGIACSKCEASWWRPGSERLADTFATKSGGALSGEDR